MEYIYAALLLHNAKKEITEESLKGVLKAVGIEADNAKLKGLIATLKDINIDEAIEKAAMPTVAAGPAPVVEEEKDEDEKPEVTEEAAAEGLGSLFG